MQLCGHKEKCVLKATSYEWYLLESITSCNWTRFTIIIFLTRHLLYQFPERMEVTLFKNFQRKKKVLKFFLNYLNFRVLFLACLICFAFVITHLSKFTQCQDSMQFDNHLGKEDIMQEDSAEMRGAVVKEVHIIRQWQGVRQICRHKEI